MELSRFHGRLSVDVPDGWRAKESITLLAGDGTANVITSSEPLDPEVTTSEYATRQGELLRSEFPGFEELSFDATRLLGNRDGYLRRFRWHPPDGRAVLQVQMYFVEDGRGYTATATLVASATEWERTAVEVLRSIRIDA
jgi:hypothetical protein